MSTECTHHRLRCAELYSCVYKVSCRGGRIRELIQLGGGQTKICYFRSTHVWSPGDLLSDASCSVICSWDLKMFYQDHSERIVSLTHRRHTQHESGNIVYVVYVTVASLYTGL